MRMFLAVLVVHLCIPLQQSYADPSPLIAVRGKSQASNLQIVVKNLIDECDDICDNYGDKRVPKQICNESQDTSNGHRHSVGGKDGAKWSLNCKCDCENGTAAAGPFIDLGDAVAIHGF